jgi:phosphohistidine swiveling domain-containing protein
VGDADPLHKPGNPHTHWSTDNVGEAVPGVMSPLGWSLWESVSDRGLRQLSYALGIFDRREYLGPASSEDPIIQVFYGRIAMSMDWLGLVGDRMPGTTGPQAIEGMLGRVPESMSFHPTRRRYPMIAWKLPLAAFRAPREIGALAAATETWWRREVISIPGAHETRTRATLVDAAGRFGNIMTVHAIGLFAAITPLIQLLTNLVERTGVGDVGTLSGTGGAEMKMVADIWRASRNELTTAQLVAAHGYHGPLEGEISSRVWREDNAPLEHLIATYREQDESSSPIAREAAAHERLPRLQRELLHALPTVQRPAARVVLRYAARTIPMRGVGKASFLQAFDVMRACARRLGELMAADGRLDTPGDVFFLTLDELTGSSPGNAKDLIARRKSIQSKYQGMSLPASWRGTPDVTRRAPREDDDVAIAGIGASSGTAEGPVRVVTDPSFADIEPGAVLVSHTTDPSWASVMFVSKALVVDLGGMLSHAAVVARELGIPCVVNTRTGTARLRDGDRVRVDGATGTVEIIERAPAVTVTVKPGM